MVDFENDSIPYETPSNKQIDITGLCLEDGTPVNIDQFQANDLNSKGIRTASLLGRKMGTLGTSYCEYEYGKEMDPRNKFDCNVRMLYYLLNDFSFNMV